MSGDSVPWATGLTVAGFVAVVQERGQAAARIISQHYSFASLQHSLSPLDRGAARTGYILVVAIVTLTPTRPPILEIFFPQLG